MLALGHLPASIIDMGGYPKEGISRPTRGRVSGCWGCPHPERKEKLTAHVPKINEKVKTKKAKPNACSCSSSFTRSA